MSHLVQPGICNVYVCMYVGALKSVWATSRKMYCSEHNTANNGNSPRWFLWRLALWKHFVGFQETRHMEDYRCLWNIWVRRCANESAPLGLSECAGVRMRARLWDLPTKWSTAIEHCLQMAAGLLRTVIQPGLTTEFPVSSELSTKPPRIGHYTTTCECQCTSNTCLTHIPSTPWPASTWPIACRHWSCCSKSCPFMNIPWIPVGNSCHWDSTAPVKIVIMRRRWCHDRSQIQLSSWGHRYRSWLWSSVDISVDA